MTRTFDVPFKPKPPTRRESIVFRCKTALLQVQRAGVDRFDGRIRRHAKGGDLKEEAVVAVSKTPLWTETEPREKYLLAGKIQNLRLAAASLNGLEIQAGRTFSFWKQVGRTSRAKGFAEGRELREGCIVPSVGGGLCQISNALYDAALQAGFEIVERHAHTQVIPGSLAEQGRDATVFWNYVDLRFSSENAFRIEAKLDAETLTVRFRGTRTRLREGPKNEQFAISGGGPNSCATCEVNECRRVVPVASNPNFGRTAFLLDEFMPEFDEYIKESRAGDDLLLIPLDGKRFRKSNYAWTTDGFGDVRQSLFVTAKRSFRSRKLAAQGAARQRNLLEMYEKLAASYAKLLRFDVLHVVVQQDLLPFLWKNGHLDGRTFDVLMTALPMKELQKRLDRAHSLHPESTTLGDFRADPDLIATETEALRHARKIVTPHTSIASLFPNRGNLLSWRSPKSEMRGRTNNVRPRIVFPASTVGRKGCYELREALQGLDVSVVLLGPPLEGGDFWKGFKIETGNEWLETADLVVLPAFVEHKPRRLLLAAAKGVPVVASTACGVGNVEGIETVEPGDVVELRERVVSALARLQSAV